MAAPGVDIAADVPGGGTGSLTGTSASAALVAGAAAALLAADPKASNGVLVGRLARTADRAGTRAQTGNGRLNLIRALRDRSRKPVVPRGVRGRQRGGPFAGPYTAAAAASQPTDIGTAQAAIQTTGITITVPAGVPAGATIIVTAGQATGVQTGSFGASDNRGNTYSVDQDTTFVAQSLRAGIIRGPRDDGLAGR